MVWWDELLRRVVRYDAFASTFWSCKVFKFKHKVTSHRQKKTRFYVILSKISVSHIIPKIHGQVQMAQYLCSTNADETLHGDQLPLATHIRLPDQPSFESLDLLGWTASAQKTRKLWVDVLHFSLGLQIEKMHWNTSESIIEKRWKTNATRLVQPKLLAWKMGQKKWGVDSGRIGNRWKLDLPVHLAVEKLKHKGNSFISFCREEPKPLYCTDTWRERERERAWEGNKWRAFLS